MEEEDGKAAMYTNKYFTTILLNKAKKQKNTDKSEERGQNRECDGETQITSLRMDYGRRKYGK